VEKAEQTQHLVAIYVSLVLEESWLAALPMICYYFIYL
jgi:hypothetical protein